MLPPSEIVWDICFTCVCLPCDPRGNRPFGKKRYIYHRVRIISYDGTRQPHTAKCLPSWGEVGRRDLRPRRVPAWLPIRDYQREIRVHSMRRSRRRGERIRQEPHTVRVTVLFSESQMEIIERYLRRHPGRSRSDFVRRCVMERIVGDATKHRPTLFDDGGEEERRR